MKRIIFLVLLAFSFNTFSQKDSIVNYLDVKGNVTKVKSKARFIETLVKKGSLWLVTKYYRNGKILKKGFYRDRNKEKPIGQFFTFYRTGNIRSSLSYNLKGKVEGISKYWFENGGLDRVGRNKNGYKIGIWRYYHTNGKNALRQYYVNNELTKNIFYDKKGNKIKDDVKLIEFQKPKFKGEGIDKFFKRIKNLHNRLNFQINGTIYINFVVDENGNITDVKTYDKVSKELKRKLKYYFEKIKGWQPAVHMNRKVPYHFNIPFNFHVEFN